MSGLSNVYAGLQRAVWVALSARAWPCMELKQRKWSWLLRGWLEALQPSEATSTNCTYMG